MTSSIFSREFSLLCFSSLLFFSSYHLLTPIFPLYLKVNHFSGMAIGSLVASFMLASLLIRPFVGKLSDEINKRTLMLVGIILFGLCPLLYLLTKDSVLLYIIRLVHGVGFALFYTSSTGYLVSLIPAERKAEGISYYSNAIKIAMAFSPGLALFLVQQKYWTEVFLLSAGISVLVATCVLLLKKPSQIKTNKKGKLLNTKAFFPGLIMATNSMAFGALIPFAPLLFAEKHLDLGQWFYTMYAIFLIASRFLTGRLSDKYGRTSVLLPGMFLVILSVLLLSGTTSEFWLLAMAGLYGLSAGTVQPSLMAMASEKASKDEQGSAMATFTMLNDVGIAAGSFIMGSLGTQVSYSYALLWIALGLASGWIALWVGTRPVSLFSRRVPG
jgi:MFS family permease